VLFTMLNPPPITLNAVAEILVSCLDVDGTIGAVGCTDFNDANLKTVFLRVHPKLSFSKNSLDLGNQHLLS